MNLVIKGPDGRDFMQTNDFTLSLQYGEVNNFELSLPDAIEPLSMVYIDGTPYGGMVDKRCPRSGLEGETIVYKGRSMQGVLESQILMPPAGATHFTASGDANEAIATVIERTGLGDVFEAEASPCGIELDNYRFYRFSDAYSGLRMMLMSVGMRLSISCRQGKHVLSAVPCKTFGRIDSEKVFFQLDCEDLPVNCLVGLGKGTGTARAVSVWYANLLGEVSQRQTLFGALENAKTFQSTSDDASTLPAKAKAKLLEYQKKSSAKVTLPEDAELDVGDFIDVSSAKYNILATTQVIGVAIKANRGNVEVSYDFGMPVFPDEED